MQQNEGKIVLYKLDETNICVNVLFEEETFWMPQKAIAELFDTTVPNINSHLKNIYSEEELFEESTIKDFLIVGNEGGREVKRTVKCYNLDMIIAIGYRVNSKKATHFRQWATRTLREYIEKGFVLNNDMLKNGNQFGKDYFDELIEAIREIRASERRAYQKIADIFEECSYDYDKTSETTKRFYAFVQNKLHFAITGKTAAEIIVNRVDAKNSNMGLTTWKKSPEGKILKSDVSIAKNYLTEKELSRLNRLVTMFIDYAELQAEDEILMSMEDWTQEVNRFLKNNRRNILEGAGNVSHKDAITKAHKEYALFRIQQDRVYISDFDNEINKQLNGGKQPEN